MLEFKGVFALFPVREKSAELGPHLGSQLGADFTSWTPAAYAESMAGAYDVVTQSEAVAVPVAAVEVEDAAARLAAGFRPMRVCMQFLKHQLGWPGRGCLPMAEGAPSHTRGLSFTRKPQPMSSSLPRTFLAEGRGGGEWAWGVSSGGGWRRKGQMVVAVGSSAVSPGVGAHHTGGEPM